MAQDALSKLTGQKVTPDYQRCEHAQYGRQLPSSRSQKTGRPTNFTPIIMLTTESQEGKKQEGQARWRQGLDRQALPAGTDAGRRIQVNSAIKNQSKMNNA